MDEPDPKSAAKETVVREHSVVEGMPDGKTERIASMRRELADLQRHLIDAQQRVATELQGRADDAERLEALETFVQEYEQKGTTRVVELETEIAGLRSQLSTATVATEELRRGLAARDARIEEARRQHAEELEARSSALNEAKTQLEARDAALATRTSEHETERATRSQLERELEDHRKQHRDVTGQLELQFTSLRDAKALIATVTSELAATTSERDVLKGELEPARHELDVARTKLRDVASQLLRLGQDLGDGGVITPTSSSSEPWISTTGVKPAPAKRPSIPPPLPGSPSQARAAVAAPVEVETIVMTEEAKPASRIGSALFALGGVVFGCAVTIAIMKWTSAPDDQVAPSSTPVAAPVEPSPVVRTEEVRPSTSVQPAPVPGPKPETAPTAPAAITATDGVLVLPASAAGHRLFVDGKIVEVKGSRASIPCGSHEVRIGSSGTARTIDIMCGVETALPEEPR